VTALAAEARAPIAPGAGTRTKTGLPGAQVLYMCEELVFLTAVCGLAPHEAAWALRRTARVVERYGAVLRAYPGIITETLARYGPLAGDRGEEVKDMSEHPPIGWDQIRAWARDNDVPATALVNVKADQGHHIPVTGYENGVIQTAFQQPAITWAELAGLVPGDGLPWAYTGGDLRRIRDLGHWAEAEDDPGTLVLQTRWG